MGTRKDRGQRRTPAPARRRDRRGRGLRATLIPARHPAARSRADRFDAVVLDEIDHLGRKWQEQIADVEFAVEAVPPPLAEFDTDVVEDGQVPLCRLIRPEQHVVSERPPARRRPIPSSWTSGGPTSGTSPREASSAQSQARIVLYRRPIEARARSRDDLGDLIFAILVEQVATLLGVDPDEVDPESP